MALRRSSTVPWNLGAYRVVSKPFEVTDMAALVTEALAPAESRARRLARLLIFEHADAKMLAESATSTPTSRGISRTREEIRRRCVLVVD
jgi:hypothetical protein